MVNMLQEAAQQPGNSVVAGRRESPLSTLLRVDTPLSVVNSTERTLQLYARFLVDLWNLRVTTAAHFQKSEWELAVQPAAGRFSELYERRRLRTIDHKLRISHYPEVRDAISSAYLRLTGVMARYSIFPVNLPKDPKLIPTLLAPAGTARRSVYAPLRKIAVELDALTGLKSIAETGDYERFRGEADMVNAIAAGNIRTLKVFRKAMRDNNELSLLFRLAIEANEAKAVLMLLAKSLRGDAFSKFFYTFTYMNMLKDDEIRAAIANSQPSAQI
ncbi:MAG: hypothetical protein LVQ95_03935 [Candidatus Micrarchaeales archaeon]|nr:hypothetical protein [Candidatus Micrarchaeales archaeon]